LSSTHKAYKFRQTKSAFYDIIMHLRVLGNTSKRVIAGQVLGFTNNTYLNKSVSMRSGRKCFIVLMYYLLICSDEQKAYLPNLEP